MQTIFKILLQGFIYVFTLSLCVVVALALYLTGLVQGYNFGKSDTEIRFVELINDEIAQSRENNNNLQLPTPIPKREQTLYQKVVWGGPDLWKAVNKRRSEFGVNPLKQKDELCTIASIRLNELLELGKLDGHAGFSNIKDKRPDLSWIFESYSTVAEFLATGGFSAQETVNMWENTLGHKKILDGGEFVWGCIYAQESFAVGIVAY